MGTPEFAVGSLKLLVENDWPVVAVITAPDRKKGRGQSVIASPVKSYAVGKKIPVLQPTNLKSPEFIETLSSYKANLQVVVAFRMLPEVVWNMPELGTFNLHASLLPNYRGAAPINWAIINGEKETGVTTFFLQHEIDTGEIIFQEKEEIRENDNVGSLYERLMRKGAELVVKTVEAVANNQVISKAQPELAAIKSAPKIFKETCEVNWNQSYVEIRNFVRGLNPYPAAWFTLGDIGCKLFAVEQSDRALSKTTGSIITDHKSYIMVRAADSWVNLLDIQLAGKKRMLVSDLLRGNPMNNLESI